MPIKSKVQRAVTSLHVSLYRRVSSAKVRRMAGLPILLLTVTGRRSGRQITTPVCYLDTDSGFAVAGSAAGSDSEPQWFRNLRVATEASVEIGSNRQTVSVRILKGAERDAMWQRLLAEGTTFAGYEQKTSRRIPVALLTPR
ncbi:nitroreductase family deazaflavin-dependent oxidoreductase [Calidifontibacter terrae]